MDQEQNRPFQLSFNASLSVNFQGYRVTSDGGLILVRELDELLSFGELIEQYLTDSRARNARLPFADLLRQSVYSRLAGYEDLNEADRLSQDPTRRLTGRTKAIDSLYRVVLDMDRPKFRWMGSRSRGLTTGTSSPPAVPRCCCSTARTRDCLAAELRPGNVHSAEGWEELMLPEIERQQKLDKEVVFRTEAAFAKPQVYEALEERA